MSFELMASMMCADYGNLEKEVKSLEEGGIDSFHIDRTGTGHGKKCRRHRLCIASFCRCTQVEQHVADLRSL